MKSLSLTAITVALMLIPTQAFAGGHGNGNSNREASATCRVEGNMVISESLPVDALLNFMVTDADGKTGWVLGRTSSGYWAVGVPDRTSHTTYEFVGRTYGKNGAKYRVYASCDAAAS
jgi:hypothetical protein